MLACTIKHAGLNEDVATQEPRENWEAFQVADPDIHPGRQYEDRRRKAKADQIGEPFPLLQHNCFAQLQQGLSL